MCLLSRVPSLSDTASTDWTVETYTHMVTLSCQFMYSFLGGITEESYNTFLALRKDGKYKYLVTDIPGDATSPLYTFGIETQYRYALNVAIRSPWKTVVEVLAFFARV